MVISEAPKTTTHPAKTANPKSGTVPTWAHLPIDGGASGMGILPMSEGLTQTHGQDARVTADIQAPPLIGRCALPTFAFFAAVLACPDRRYLPERYDAADRATLLEEYGRLKLRAGRR
jgi:hypothetical protein